eukprot:2168064-Pleurochrysis_carterae.AAC.2
MAICRHRFERESRVREADQTARVLKRAASRARCMQHAVRDCVVLEGRPSHPVSVRVHAATRAHVSADSQGGRARFARARASPCLCCFPCA